MARYRNGNAHGSVQCWTRSEWCLASAALGCPGGTSAGAAFACSRISRPLGGSEGRKWLEDMTTVTTVLREWNDLNVILWMKMTRFTSGVSPLKIYYLWFFPPDVPLLQVRCDLLYIFVPYEVKTEYLKTRWSRVRNDQRPCFPESEIGSHFTPRRSKWII